MSPFAAVVVLVLVVLSVATSLLPVLVETSDAEDAQVLSLK